MAPGLPEKTRKKTEKKREEKTGKKNTEQKNGKKWKKNMEKRGKQHIKNRLAYFITGGLLIFPGIGRT